MSLNEIQVSDHPLRTRVIQSGITLWRLRLALGGEPSENKLSRILRGIDEMSPNLERRIEKILAESDSQEDRQ